MENKIKVGDIVFDNIKTYSQDDKVRKKFHYKATILGFDIYVGNDKAFNDNKVFLECKGAGINGVNFVNKNISAENACRESLRYVLEKLNLIITKISSNI